MKILEEREKERGDRVLGRARGLYDLVHSFSNYDVTVDTSKLSVEECIAKIKKLIT
jgi:chloramphenicol 3-O phosphotransferase